MESLKINGKDWKITTFMRDDEREFLLSFLQKDDVMLEFGCGGSTIEFSQHVKEYHSIEHSQNWYEQIKKFLENQQNIFMYYIPNDIPRTIEFGPSKYEEFKTYIQYVNVINKKFNKVLIDGRGRQWCAEEVIPYLDENAIVFIHDFGTDHLGRDIRKRYNSVLKYYSIIGKVCSLVALKKKK